MKAKPLRTLTPAKIAAILPVPVLTSVVGVTGVTGFLQSGELAGNAAL